ncbi:MAG: polyprenol monophosphomannose synthase [Acidimicrobiia bacterium]
MTSALAPLQGRAEPSGDPANLSTLVVLPTYDERENIETVLRRIRFVVPAAHVLVVDDGSPDGTAEIAEDVARDLRGISVLRRPRPTGLGNAYRAGFRWGLDRGYGVLVEMDADLSHDPLVLPELLHAVSTGADLAIGSRYTEGGATLDWPWLRRMISRNGCRYAQVMLRLPARDATSGFRAYRAATLEAIDLDRVQASGYGFQVEMTYRAARNGARITEVPIEFRDRVAGTSKMSTRIVIEAFLLVTRWGVADRWKRSRSRG